MTVDTKEQNQWGNGLVQVKKHPREYKTGKVIVPTYSAKCPNSHKRKRLKKTYRSIYTMNCGNEDVEVDIESGHYVDGIAIKVNAFVPERVKLITASEFERTRRDNHNYGWSDTLFEVDELNAGLLNWWLIYTNEQMTKGVGVALLNGEHIYIKFSH